MDNSKTPKPKTVKNNTKFDIEIKGIDIDKNEYQEIVLSNSNHPESTYFDRYRD